jgi:hypothetical protein
MHGYFKVFYDRSSGPSAGNTHERFGSSRKTQYYTKYIFFYLEKPQGKKMLVSAGKIRYYIGVARFHTEKTRTHSSNEIVRFRVQGIVMFLAKLVYYIGVARFQTFKNEEFRMKIAINRPFGLGAENTNRYDLDLTRLVS